MSLVYSSLLLVLLALSIEAKIYAWGLNDYGQLGLNGTIIKFPTAIPAYNNLDIVQIKASTTFHIGIASNGDVYVSGNNWYGGLGLPIPSVGTFVGIPRKNPSLSNCKVYVGRRHGNAVCGKKFVGWGVQSGYVAGLEEGIYGKIADSLPIYNLNSNVVDVFAGSHFTLVTAANGTKYIAGEGSNGVLGLGDTSSRPRFVTFDAFDNIPLQKIFPSHAEHVCALSQSNSLYCWGANDVGQLGIGSTDDQPRPTLVSFFEQDHYVVQVTTGSYHTLALTASGRVFAWGQAQNGVLGNGRSDNVTFSTPIEIESLADKDIVEIVSGLNFNFVRTAQNEWYCWGAGSGGVLGMRSDQDFSRPVLAAFSSVYDINTIVTSSTSRSAFGFFDPAVPTTIQGPPLVNECLTPGKITCENNAHCQDTDRSAQCACDTGFAGDVDNCQDINECLASAGACVSVATCTNLLGSYTCSCPANLPIGDGKATGTGCKAAPTNPPTTPPTTPPTAPPPTTPPTTTSTRAPIITGNGNEPTVTEAPKSTTTPTTPTVNSTNPSGTGNASGNASGNGTGPANGNGNGNGNGNSDTTATTTGGSAGPSSSTTRKGYQTLTGREIPVNDENQVDSFLTLPTNAPSQSDGGDTWKKIMIGVIVVFGVLIVGIVAFGLVKYFKS